MQAEPGTPLLWVIREQAGLTGTKYGCGVAQCGACSVHINGEVRRSCSIPISAINFFIFGSFMRSSHHIRYLRRLEAARTGPLATPPFRAPSD